MLRVDGNTEKQMKIMPAESATPTQSVETTRKIAV